MGEMIRKPLWTSKVNINIASVSSDLREESLDNRSEQKTNWWNKADYIKHKTRSPSLNLANELKPAVVHWTPLASTRRRQWRRQTISTPHRSGAFRAPNGVASPKLRSSTIHKLLPNSVRRSVEATRRTERSQLRSSLAGFDSGRKQSVWSRNSTVEHR